MEILREAGSNGMHVKDLCRLVKELRLGEKDAPDQENLNPERLGASFDDDSRVVSHTNASHRRSYPTRSCYVSLAP